MLTAYFDESYNQLSEKRPNDPLLFTVGCCLSTVEEWRKLGVRWKSELKRKPRIPFFHMTDYESRHRYFSDWSNVMRVKRLQRFHQIMKDHIKYHFSGTVNRADIDTIFSKRKGKQPLLDYYFFGTVVCMDAISTWCEKNQYDKPIHYVFAHLDKQGSYFDEWFAHCLNTPELRKRYRLASMWARGIMKDVPQLQAADILAYEMNKRAVNEFGEGKNFVRKSLDNLNFENCDSLYYGIDEIRAVADDINQETK